jgi:hypothetical protein
MNLDDPQDKAEEEQSKADDTPLAEEPSPKELGGRGGLDPTRYGDWEKAGRCVDF